MIWNVTQQEKEDAHVFHADAHAEILATKIQSLFTQ